MFPSDKKEKVLLRLPDGMRRRIRLHADANRRSMNSEIVHYLDRALAAQDEEGPAGAPTPPSHGSDQPRQEKANEHVRD
jgi:plasmid stability protein